MLLASTSCIKNTSYQNKKEIKHQASTALQGNQNNISPNNTIEITEGIHEDHPTNDTPEPIPEHATKDLNHFKKVEIELIYAHISEKSIDLEMRIKNYNNQEKEIKLSLNIEGLDTIDMAKSNIITIKTGESVQTASLHTDGKPTKTPKDEIIIEIYPYTRPGPHEVSIQSTRHKLKFQSEKNGISTYKKLNIINIKNHNIASPNGHWLNFPKQGKLR